MITISAFINPLEIIKYPVYITISLIFFKKVQILYATYSRLKFREADKYALRETMC